MPRRNPPPPIPPPCLPPALVRLERLLAATGAADVAEDLNAAADWQRWFDDCTIRDTDPLIDTTDSAAASPSVRAVQRRLGGMG